MCDGISEVVGACIKEDIDILSSCSSDPALNSHIKDQLSDNDLNDSLSYEDMLSFSSPGSPENPLSLHILNDPASNHPESENEGIGKKRCLVCGDTASGYHYGAASCEACKAFFKRTIQGNISYRCPAFNDCEINKRRRKACQACRFQKCLQKGMLKEGVRLDRVRGGRQKYRHVVDISANAKQPTDSKPVVDNKILEVLLGCEPNILSAELPEFESPQPSVVLLATLSNLIDKELLHFISWAKQIPGFSDLSLENQMKMLQCSWTEVLTLALVFRSLPPSGRLLFANDFSLDKEEAQSCGIIDFYLLCIRIIDRLQQISITREEYLILKALVLANSDVILDEKDKLKQFRSSLTNSLNSCVTTKRGSSCETTSIVLCLPVLRQADIIVRKFWNDVHQSGLVPMKKLFIEMLFPDYSKSELKTEF